MILEMFQKGGPIMWPLLVVSVLALSVAFERVYFLIIQRLRTDRSARREVRESIESGNVSAALERAFGSRDPFLCIAREGLRDALKFEKVATIQAEEYLEQYDEGLGLLDTAITIAPLLGLLGTVTGMMSSFGMIGGSELEAPSAITGGIAEALIATAYGLGIAITALLPFNLMHTMKEKTQRELERFLTTLEKSLSFERPVRREEAA